MCSLLLAAEFAGCIGDLDEGNAATFGVRNQPN